MTANSKEYQKAASRKHYLANKEAVKQRSKLKSVEMRKYVIDLKSTTPCVDCKTIYPYYVMDFDHLPEYEKSMEITRLVNFGSWDRLLNEIAKCDLVCSNCHRKRTYTRLCSSTG